MDYQSIITFFMEMAGTVAFAASGAMVGVERNMDIFGVSLLVLFCDLVQLLV